jgi:signal transduction histidine kinase
VNATLVRALGYPPEELFQLSVYEAGVAAFVARLDLPVELDVTSERLHPDIEASAYFIVAEAVTNVVKHAGATQATVEDGVLALAIADDGAGGPIPRITASSGSPTGSPRTAAACASTARPGRS